MVIHDKHTITRGDEVVNGMATSPNLKVEKEAMTDASRQ